VFEQIQTKMSLNRTASSLLPNCHIREIAEHGGAEVMEGEEDDGFWEIALSPQGSKESFETVNEGDGATSEDEETIAALASYKITIDGRTTVLQLQSLSLQDGVFSPLGSQPWYASALLSASFIIESKDPSSRFYRHLSSFKSPINALELGCGAVALPGLVLSTLQNVSVKSILLSDNDDRVLNVLQRNVERTIRDEIRLDLKVQKLDWNDDSLPILPSLQLVFGAELVYTEDTAESCARLLLRLLKTQKDLVVVIVQMADRPGWTHFLAILEESNICAIVEEPLIDADVHGLAQSLIPHIGASDRFGFSIAYITATKN